MSAGRRLPGLWAALLGLAVIVGVGAIVSQHFGRSQSATLAALAVGVVVGVLMRRMAIRVANPRAPMKLFSLGAGSALVAVGMRVAALLSGADGISVSIAGRSLVLGEIAVVLLVIGVGAMLAALTAHNDHLFLAWAPSQRGGIRFLAVIIASVPAVVFVLLSRHDLGPAVVAAVAILVMSARALESKLALVVSGIILLSLSIAVLGVSEIARERFAGGGFQFDVANAAIRNGGLLFGGGFDSNGIAEQIPVAESDMLPAYLMAAIGVVPFTLMVSLLFFVLRRLVRRTAKADDAGAIAALGVITAALIQTLWPVLANVGWLPLTGIPVPFLSAAGSSWLAWGIAAGFLLGQPWQAAESDAVTGFVTAASGAAALIVPVAVVVAGCGLIFGTQPISRLESLMLPRGEVISRDGTVMAYTDETGVRRAPQLTGELTGTVVSGYNAWGIEDVAGSILGCGGSSSVSFLAGLIGPRCASADVVTTVDGALQTALAAELAQTPQASGIILNGSTGGVLAAYTNDGRPSAEQVLTAEVQQDFEALEGLAPSNPDSPLWPGILEDGVAPASTFKVAVLAIAAEQGIVNASDPVASEVQGFTNWFESACPGADIPAALTYSCNTTTIDMAQQIGQQALAEGLAYYFGVGEEQWVDGLRFNGGVTGLSQEMDGTQFARTALGMEGVRISLLQLATIYSSALGLGQSAPSVIAGVCVGDEFRAADEVPDTGLGSFSDSTHALIREGMSGAARIGTAEILGENPALSGHEVYAKTGTADTVVEGIVVYDSLTVVSVDGIVLVLRVPGSVDAPRPNSLSHASNLASLLATGAEDTTPECSARGGNDG